MMSRLNRSRKYLLMLGTLLALLLALLLPAAPALADPVLDVSPAAGAVGTRITISGTVFDSYKGDDIYIFVDDAEIPGSPLVIGDTGTFSTEFNVPGGTDDGPIDIEVRRDTSSSSMLAKTFFVVEETEIDIDTIDGPVGTTVTVTGRGFYSSRAIIVNYYNIIGEKVGSAMTSAIGEFEYQFDIPFSTAGKHRVVAENAEGNEAEVKFEVTPSLTLNLTEGPPGELLKARGTGFDYRTEVEISFAAKDVALAKTDDYGSFEVDFNIPDVTPGTYYVRAVDIQGNIDRATFAAIGGVSVSQSEGAIGEQLTIDGAGFDPGQPVTIDYDDLRVATKVADNNGEFSSTFGIPESGSGSHVITVSDGKTTKQFTFKVESDPPPPPGMLLPANSSETKAQAHLDWQDVSDLSEPVTYSMQVAADSNFSNVVLEKTELAASEYALEDDERLAAMTKDSPYYWRTKARDGAGNDSEWSSPWTFFVSAPPAPELSLPVTAENTKEGISLDWADVTSLSPPVAYSLQMSTDLDFKDIMLEKDGLNVSEYVLSEEEDLADIEKGTPYYWRVKAIDDANNESDWSAPQTFTVESSFNLPGWAKYVFIGIGVVVVICLAFILGRRTAFSEPD